MWWADAFPMFRGDRDLFRPQRPGDAVDALAVHDHLEDAAHNSGGFLVNHLGRKVLGKTVCENYKTKSTRRTAPEEQFVFEGAIPAIIDEETWHNVQRLRETMRRTPKRSSGPNRLTAERTPAHCCGHTSLSAGLQRGSPPPAFVWQHSEWCNPP